MPRTWTQIRSDLARKCQTDPSDTEGIAALRRDLRVARVADSIKVLVEQEPLTGEQLDRLHSALPAACSHAT